jgi:hypothetical protein
MPVTFASTDRKIVFSVLAGFVMLTIVAALFTAPEGSEGNSPPTTYSAASSGTKAVYLLLKESGWRVDRWENSPAELPKDEGATYILAEPDEFPTTEERSAIATFVREGGRLVIAGGAAAEILPMQAAKSDFRHFDWTKHRALAPSRYTSAAEITMREEAHWDADKGSYVPLYGESSDKAVAVKFSYGKGEVIWWAAATPLTNGGITEAGNLEFVMACLSDSKRQVFFDEYYHGHRPGEALSDTGRALWWMLAQVSLLAVAIVLTFSRRSGPIQAPRPETRLSPLEFVETLGGLYERANASAVPVEVAHQRFRYRLTRRLGLPMNAPVEVIESSAANLLAYRNPELGRVLRACQEATRSAPSKQTALELVKSLQMLAGELKLYPAAKRSSHSA